MGNFINERYKGKYRRPQDWVAGFLASYTQNEDGSTNVDALMALAKKNGVDVSQYTKHLDKAGGIGRVRMAIGNRLRAMARRRHALMDAEGNAYNIPKSELDHMGAKDAPTETIEGQPIETKAA